MKKIILAFLFCLSLKSLLAQDTLQPKPFVLGTIHKIFSKELNETRTLNIYLPEGYNPSDTVHYPVIYLLDGSADEDFIHVVGLVQFFNFPWVNMLEKSIVVGISNVDRRRDLTFPTTIEKDKKDFPTTGHSAPFIAFIEKELQPHIEKNFITGPGKTIIGQSLGGLLATEVLFTKPHLFDRYVIISPSLWWDNESLLAKKPVAPPQKVAVYIASGKEGKIMERDVKRLSGMLSKNNKDYSVKRQPFYEEDHATIMHQAAYRGMQWMKGK
jgi:predicted alpha/beta superfamily hydrolase